VLKVAFVTFARAFDTTSCPLARTITFGNVERPKMYPQHIDTVATAKQRKTIFCFTKEIYAEERVSPTETSPLWTIEKLTRAE
jgi:hypothetical protein